MTSPGDPTTDGVLLRRAALLGMQEEVVRNTKEKGWYDTDRSFGDDIALLHSEVSEALEAYRDHGTESMQEHYDVRCIDDKRDCVCTPKPLGVGSEFADVLIRLLDSCARYGIDLAAEYEAKTAFNRTRPYRHGGRAL